MQATLEHVGHDLVCRSGGATPVECPVDGETLLPALKRWPAATTERCARTTTMHCPRSDASCWGLLDASGWASAWVAAGGARSLEIRVADPAQPLAAALLDAPWELLCAKSGFLADDDSQLFELVRRIGAPAPAAAPRHADLQLMVMAAAPLGAEELDFEAEEAAILEVTQNLRSLHLVVEESGAAQPLAQRLALDGPFEALHLSCHGDIDPKHGAYLAFEDAEGAMERATAGDLAGLLGDTQSTSLVFLSACRTAEQAHDALDVARATEPFVRNLIRAGVLNVLGWDGSVYDSDAAAFARVFYQSLAMLAPIGRAAAVARQQLRLSNVKDARQGQHWHLARLYIGPQGGGPLAAKGLPTRKHARTSQFLDQDRREVPVASRLAFVGRRRPIQAVMRAFAAGSAGVLVHGMGNLGKSSMAHRVSTRMTNHQTVVVFRHYDAMAMLDRLLDAVPPAQRLTERATWREAVVASPAVFADAVEALLDGPFDAHPILLVIDDLERVLEAPVPEAVNAATLVQPAGRAPLAAVLAAFAKLCTPSRLLITSRYTFSLHDAHGRDLAAGLTHVPLRPMAPGERIKQLRAAASPQALAGIDWRLAERALATADGNPGLQATLMTPLLAGEAAAAEKAIDMVESFQRSGVAPASLDALVAQGVAQDEGNALLAFFRRMAFDVYRAALTPEQARLLAGACLFTPGLPIPHTAFHAVGAALGVAAPPAALHRLLALGLLDDWGVQANDEPAASVNPLARPLVETLQDEDALHSASAAVPPLAAAWTDSARSIVRDARGVELARLALRAPNVDLATLDRAATAAAAHLFGLNEARRAVDGVLRPTLARLASADHALSASLAQVAFDCADQLVEMDVRRSALQSMASSVGSTEMERGGNLLRLADANRNDGELDEAERMVRQSLVHFENAGSLRDAMIAKGKVAKILHARGQLDQAVRVLEEELLPAFDLMGDERSSAVTIGKIADILHESGQLDEALSMRQERQLPVFERLGDVRGMAIAIGKIADILQARGQMDEALRIRREEELPIYERLGAARERAVTMGKIADVMEARGQIDEALRIRRQDELPVFERLGDVLGKAVTMGKIADNLRSRGQFSEALRIHEEDELPVYERLGDVRSKAMTMGKIADILKDLGQLDDAIRMHDDCAAAFKALGDPARFAHAQYSVARLMVDRGDHQRGGIQGIYDKLSEAFEICLGSRRADAIAGIGSLLAEVMAFGGLTDQALVVLAHVESAYATLNHETGLSLVAKLRQAIEARG